MYLLDIVGQSSVKSNSLSNGCVQKVGCVVDVCECEDKALVETCWIKFLNVVRKGCACKRLME